MFHSPAVWRCAVGAFSPNAVGICHELLLPSSMADLRPSGTASQRNPASHMLALTGLCSHRCIPAHAPAPSHCMQTLQMHLGRNCIPTTTTWAVMAPIMCRRCCGTWSPQRRESSGCTPCNPPTRRTVGCQSARSSPPNRSACCAGCGCLFTSTSGGCR